MKVSIISYFRNSSSYIERYCNQMDELQILLSKTGNTLQLTLGYGDSTDDTNEKLFDECLNRFDCILLDVSHGGPNYGSIVHAERFKQLSYIGNKLWLSMPKDSDIVGLVESDLIWQGDTLACLLNHVEGSRSLEIVSPMVLHLNGDFYDTWAFRRGFNNFDSKPPYHIALTHGKRYIEMDSVGSVLFMQGELGRRLYWPEKDVVVGLCKQAEALGADIILDTESKVYHP